MSYYQFKRQEILQKAKENYSKEKAAQYYLKNKEVIKEKSKKQYKKLSRQEKDKVKGYQREKCQQLIQYKKEALQNKLVLFYQLQKLSEKTLKHDIFVVDKMEFHKSKQPIRLNLVNVDEILISDKCKHSDDGFKYFIGYKKDDIVKSLCIILPQMSGYKKYFENRGKNVSFIIKDDDVLEKYNEIWNELKRH